MSTRSASMFRYPAPEITVPPVESVAVGNPGDSVGERDDFGEVEERCPALGEPERRAVDVPVADARHLEDLALGERGAAGRTETHDQLGEVAGGRTTRQFDTAGDAGLDRSDACHQRFEPSLEMWAVLGVHRHHVEDAAHSWSSGQPDPGRASCCAPTRATTMRHGSSYGLRQTWRVPFWMTVSPALSSRVAPSSSSRMQRPETTNS